MMSELGIVDVGGTGITTYLNGMQLGYRLMSSVKNGPSGEINNEDNIHNEIKKQAKFLKQRGARSVIVGLPGPVMEMRQGLVNCPPLGVVIDIKRIIECEMMVVNDTICQLYLIDKTIMERGETSVLLTVGTSLGCCSFKSEDISIPLGVSVESHELAHEKLIMIDNMSILLDDCALYNKIQRRIVAHQMFSAGGFAEFCGLNTYIDSNNMKIVMKEELREAIRQKRIKENAIERWSLCLNHLVWDFLCKKGIPIKGRPILRGGLIKAFANTHYTGILSKYFTLSV